MDTFTKRLTYIAENNGHNVLIILAEIVAWINTLVITGTRVNF